MPEWQAAVLDIGPDRDRVQKGSRSKRLLIVSGNQPINGDVERMEKRVFRLTHSVGCYGRSGTLHELKRRLCFEAAR